MQPARLSHPRSEEIEPAARPMALAFFVPNAYVAAEIRVEKPGDYRPRHTIRGHVSHLA
jgi:hypothetical protein